MKKSLKKIWYWICLVVGTLLLGSALIELIFLKQAISSQQIASGLIGAIIILSISKKLNLKEPKKEEEKKDINPN